MSRLCWSFTQRRYRLCIFAGGEGRRGTEGGVRGRHFFPVNDDIECNTCSRLHVSSEKIRPGLLVVGEATSGGRVGKHSETWTSPGGERYDYCECSLREERRCV